MNIFEAIKNAMKEKITVIPEVFNDPLALTIEWTPLVKGGANFQTHEAKHIDSNRIEFKRTPMMIAFPFIFLIFPTVFLIIFLSNSSKDYFSGEYSVYIFTIFIFIFIGFGFYLWKISNKSIVFDKIHGYYWKGNYDPRALNPDNEKYFVRLKEIYALQIISERVTGSKGSSYRSYELNLILKSGQRVNVVDHGNIENLRSDAKIISGFLNVPVWDASVRVD